MKLVETDYDNSETGCCARLDVAAWDEKEVAWQDKPFLRDHVRSFFHIPLNYGAVMKRDHAAVEAAEAYARDPIVLTDDSSLWGADVYVAVDRDVPGAEIDRLTGRFLTKVFEGPYRDAGKWVREMRDFVRAKGQEAEMIYFYYATCPKCAKRFGENNVVLVARVA